MGLGGCRLFRCVGRAGSGGQHQSQYAGGVGGVWKIEVVGVLLLWPWVGGVASAVGGCDSILVMMCSWWCL